MGPQNFHVPASAEWPKQTAPQRTAAQVPGRQPETAGRDIGGGGATAGLPTPRTPNLTTPAIGIRPRGVSPVELVGDGGAKEGFAPPACSPLAHVTLMRVRPANRVTAWRVAVSG
jgi:hypothetical protein